MARMCHQHLVESAVTKYHFKYRGIMMKENGKASRLCFRKSRLGFDYFVINSDKLLWWGSKAHGG